MAKRREDEWNGNPAIPRVFFILFKGMLHSTAGANSPICIRNGFRVTHVVKEMPKGEYVCEH